MIMLEMTLLVSARKRGENEMSGNYGAISQ